jgi:predicted RNase H-like HicB family nuclease
LLIDILKGIIKMKKLQFTFWQEDDYFIGFLNDYPDYQTQGITKEELIENLKDLLVDIESEQIPYLRKVEELLVA